MTMDLVEQVARIYAKNDGLDPDEAHIEVEHIANMSITGEIDTKEVKKDTGKKKWEFYVNQARSFLDAYQLVSKLGDNNAKS